MWKVRPPSEAAGGIHSAPQCFHVLPEVEDSSHLFLSYVGTGREPSGGGQTLTCTAFHGFLWSILAQARVSDSVPTTQQAQMFKESPNLIYHLTHDLPVYCP